MNIEYEKTLKILFISNNIELELERSISLWQEVRGEAEENLLERNINIFVKKENEN